MSKIREIIGRKDKRKAKLQKSLDLIVPQLKNMGALKIILFGSLVKGDVDVNSDIDLFVLMPSTKTGREWMDLIYRTVERKVASNIIVYNEEEFYGKLPSSSFLGNILEGKVVYEKAA
jgi:predicted nucleotidyltransferase